MSPEDLNYFKDKLTEMRQSLAHDSGVTLQDMQTESTLYPDPSDRASLEAERITTLRIRDRERKLVVKVEEALERIQSGGFGLCESCEEPIGKARLEIRPVTTLCIQCKEIQERGERLQKAN